MFFKDSLSENTKLVLGFRKQIPSLSLKSVLILGWVDTDMSSHKGPLSIDRGAESTVFAALLPPNTDVKGAYIWHDCQIVDWVNGPTPPMT